MSRIVKQAGKWFQGIELLGASSFWEPIVDSHPYLYMYYKFQIVDFFLIFMAGHVVRLSDQSVVCSVNTSHFSISSPVLEPWPSKY